MSTERLVAGTLIDAKNPWPGLSAFDEAAQRFFSGRDAESAELLRLVGQAPLTVLFGKSGLGKTSLVQAGLFPRLRQQNILPVYVRLNVRDRSAPLIQQAAAALQAEIGKHGVDTVAPKAGESLWEHLHGRHIEWWSAKNQPLTPIFVFDQFEEAFTLGAENADAIERLRLDLADLIENRIPADLAQRIEAGTSAEQLDLRGQRYKLLLSFREDFLPEVEGWKRELPSVMRNRLRLLPMSADRALQVVSGQTPTGKTHELVDDETAREIVGFVAAVQTRDEMRGSGKNIRKAADPTWEKVEIEPALLSLLCEGLNDKRKARGQATIDAALLKETGEAIIGDFYSRCVADVPEKTRRFIEDALITEGGFRNSYPLQDAIDQGVITEPLLRDLVDRRLLRIDHQLGADRVELIHDRLTAVVREQRDKQRERLRARRQRRLWWAVGSVGVVLVAIGAVFFHLWLDAQSAEKQTRAALQEVERQKNDAEVAKKTAIEKQLEAEGEKKRADAEATRAKEETLRAESATARAIKSLEETSQAKQRESLAAATAKRAADEAKSALRDVVAGKLILQSRTLLDGQKTIPMDIALLLVAAGFRLNPNSDGLSALDYALNATPGLLKAVSFPEPVLNISNDGRVVITGNKQKNDVIGLFTFSSKTVLHLGDPTTGRYRGSTLTVEGTWPNIAFSPDSKTIATAYQDANFRETVSFWNSATADPLGMPITHQWFTGPRTSVVVASPHISFSPDGTRIVSSSVDLTLRLWDVASGQTLRAAIPKPKDPASPDSKTNLSREETTVAREEKLALSAVQAMEDANKELVTCVAFSSDGETVLAGYGNGNVGLWNVASGQEQGALLKLHTDQVTDIAFSADGQTAASLDIRGTLYLWNLANMQVASTRRLGPGNVKSFAFNPDGKTIVTGTIDGNLALWDTTTGEARSQPIKGHVRGVERVTFISKEILASAGDKTLRLWDIAAWQSDGKPLTGHSGPVTSVVFSPEGNTVVSGSSDGTLRLWSTATSQSVQNLLPEHSLSVDRSGKGVVVAFASDGKTFSSLNFDGTVQVWDLLTRKAIGSDGRVFLSGDKGAIRVIAFSSDGKRIAFASDSRLHLFEVATRRLVCEPWKAHVAVRDLAFSTDGKTIVSFSSFGRDVKIWDAGTCKQLGKTVITEEAPEAVAISSDATIVVSGYRDGTLRLWDIISGHALGGSLEGHAGAVTAIAFSPNGKILASGSVDNTVRLWDVASRQPIGGALKGHTGKVTVVAFSPDGKSLVSGSSDKTLRLWEAPNTWIDRICTKVVRNLSRSEWKQYVGDILYEEQCPGLPVPVD